MFWNQTYDAAALTEVDQSMLWGRQFLNVFAFVDAPAPLAELVN